MGDTAIETPSGKGAGDENFPVGSLLLPKHLRPQVADFYRFARAIDDIADNPDLAPDDKVRRLSRMEEALLDPDDREPALATSHKIRDSLKACGVTPRHCQDLVAAFKQDATKLRYQDWADLLGYCRLSANPVGRYLLDLHGESESGYPASDALCSALQVLNHLQDCQDDYRALDRVYLPEPWLAAEGLTVEALDGPASPAGLRVVIDRCLDGVDDLMDLAETLPARLTSRRLAMESEIIVRLARRLTTLLRAGDPLAARVALSKFDFLRAGIGGIASVQFQRLFRRAAKAKPLTRPATRGDL